MVIGNQEKKEKEKKNSVIGNQKGILLPIMVIDSERKILSVLMVIGNQKHFDRL